MKKNKKKNRNAAVNKVEVENKETLNENAAETQEETSPVKESAIPDETAPIETVDEAVKTEEATATEEAAATEVTENEAPSEEKPLSKKKEKPELKPFNLKATIKEKVFASNPVFVKFIAAIPILGAAVTLKNGILISAVMLLTVVFLNIVMYPLCKIVPKRFRHITAFVVAGILIAPQLYAASIFIPTVTTLCAFYLPLTAVSAIPMVETKYHGTRHGFSRTIMLAFLDACGFAFAALIFSVLREILGSGLLYERPMPYGSGFKLPFLTIPAGAFILLGLFAALWKKMFGANVSQNEEDNK